MLFRSHGKTRCVELVLDAKASVDCCTGSGFTPLYLAGLQGNADIVQRLLEAQAGVNAQSNDGFTFL